MSQTYFSKLTPAGSAAVSAAVISGTALQLAELSIGDANGASYQPTGNEAGLVNEVHRLNLTSVAAHPDNAAWTVLEAVVPIKIGGFWIREAAVYDANGDLFAIANYPETYKPLPVTGVSSSLTIRIVLQVTDATAVTLSIDARDGYATQAFVDGALSNKSDFGHQHGIADVALLQSKLDELEANIAAASSAASQALSSSEVDSRIQSVVGAAPAALDTLAEIAAKLNLTDDERAAILAQITALQAAINALAIGDIDSLQAALDSKASISHNHDGAYAAISHGHSIANIDGLQAALNNLQSSINGKAAASHNHNSLYHTKDEIEGLLNGAGEEWFISGNCTIPTQANVSASHGFGARPRMWAAYFICTAAYGGWSVGDMANVNNIDAGRAERNGNSWANATDIGLYIGERFYMTKRSGGGYMNIASLGAYFKVFFVGVK